MRPRLSSKRYVAFSRQAVLVGLLAATLAGGVLVAGDDLLELTARVEAAVRMEPFGGMRCAYREATGRPCIGCGGTTAFVLARSGRIRDALRENPLGVSAVAGLVAIVFSGLASTVSGRVWWTGLGVLCAVLSSALGFL